VLPREVIAPVESVFPTSIGGWVGLVAGTTALALLIVDRLTARGKNLATIDRKIDGLCDQVEDIENTQKVMDGHLDTLSQEVRDLRYEWQGRDGNNGGRQRIREHETRIRAIEDRNIKIDAVTARERESYGGPERRRDLRREIDREINGIIPEEREEKP
jgi:hypothetical protein